MEKKKPTPLFSAIPLEGIEVRSKEGVRAAPWKGGESRSLIQIQKAAPFEGRRFSPAALQQAEGDTARKRATLRGL